MKEIRQYSSRSAAKRGMWNYYNKNFANNGSPLIGDGGTILQWVDNSAGRTCWLSVTKNNNGIYVLEGNI